MSRPRLELATGSRFGKWTVQGSAASRGGRAYWAVLCECGVKREVSGQSLRDGQSKACASCAKKTHGLSNTPTYAVWKSMVARCVDSTNPDWEDYGGRGVVVCKRWLSFENFLKDMGTRPEGLQLDRKKNHLGYSKANCHWVTSKANNRNRRNNRIVVYQGRKMSLAEASELSGVNRWTLHYRIKKGDRSDVFRPVC